MNDTVCEYSSKAVENISVPVGGKVFYKKSTSPKLSTNSESPSVTREFEKAPSPFTPQTDDRWVGGGRKNTRGRTFRLKGTAHITSLGSLKRPRQPNSGGNSHGCWMASFCQMSWRTARSRLKCCRKFSRTRSIIYPETSIHGENRGNRANRKYHISGIRCEV